MYKVKMFRDRIVLNKQLKDYILQTIVKFTPVGSPGNRRVLLAAREVSLENNYTFELPDCDLVIVTDDFNTSKGTVKLPVTNDVPDGQPGLPGRSLLIVCKNWSGGTGFLLKGGKGGRGLRGAQGAPGKDGEMMASKNDGQDGGKGGTGLKGGTGGKGGELTISYVQKSNAGILFPTTLVPGGDGGEGGPGGYGGPGGAGVEWCKPDGSYCVTGKDGKTGPVGNMGSAGASGQYGTCHITQLTARNSYRDALAVLEVPVKEWADYRFTIGEYFFRAFSYQNPTFLKLALNEFDAVINMDITNGMALNYRNQLLRNQNIFGLSRDADIIPDFSRYEDVYTDYHPIVQGIFSAALNMLSDDVLLGQKKQDLQREISNFTGMISALGDDVYAAAIGKEISDKEVTRAGQRLEDIKRKIAERREELENPEVDIFGTIIGVVGVVASLVAAIPSMGTSLVGAATSIAVIAGTLESAGLGEIMTEAANPDADQTALNKLKNEAKGLKGFIEDVEKGVAMVVSFTKMIDECRSANVEDEEYKQLIEEAIELAHQQLIAKMHQDQAAYALQAAEKRYAQAIANKAAAEKQLSGLLNDMKVFEEAALCLIRIAQHYMNILTKYAFLAARALEIYTLVDKSKDIRFDYGYIHPDKEADYKCGFASLPSLITWYQQSWSNFANLITYKEQYDNYFTTGSWGYDYHKMSITDASVLNEFKAKRELRFSVYLADIPSSRFEAKAETVYVALVGATSNSDSISTIVEHSGSYTERKRDGKLIEATLKPRSGIVIAKQSALSSDIGVLGSSEPGIDFWGRGLAADWYLYIEQEVFDNAQVNLAAVTEIQVWFVYQSFRLSAVQGNQALVNDGTLIEDETGKLYVTYGGAKMIIPDTKILPQLGLQNTAIDKTRSKEFISDLPIIPKNNTLLRANASHKIYVINKGLRLEVGSTDVITKLGKNMADVKNVPDPALDMLLYGGVAK